MQVPVVMEELVACDSQVKEALADTLEVVQEITQAGPNTFHRVAVEFIPLSFWYDAPLTSPYSDRRHDPWLVYGSPSCSPAQ